MGMLAWCTTVCAASGAKATVPAAAATLPSADRSARPQAFVHPDLLPVPPAAAAVAAAIVTSPAKSASVVLSLELRRAPGGGAIVMARDLSGDTVAEVGVDVEQDDLRSLKDAIEAQAGLPRHLQRLSFGGLRRCRDFVDGAKLVTCFGGPPPPEVVPEPGEVRQGPGSAELPGADLPAKGGVPATPSTVSGSAEALLSPSQEPMGGEAAPRAKAKPRLRPPLLVSSSEETISPGSPGQTGGGGRRPPLRLAPPPPLDSFETHPLDTRVWSEDIFGTMVHKPSGTRVSPEKGIMVDGVCYRLSPQDIELKGAILGAGSGGVVQVGWHKPSGERIAIKTLRVGQDEAKREQMLKEIRGLVQAEGCPYLIQWYAGFVDRATGHVHVAVELMDLGSFADLQRRLDGRGVPAGPLSCVAAQIIRGLHHLQRRELLHRDVKPGNILHNAAGRVKLSDFGISKDLRAMAEVGTTFVGTATYMAPERARGGEYSYQSDVWSAGLVLYELATGSYPFASASFPELYECLTEKPEPRLQADAFPSPLCDLVAQCLTRDPAHRPDAAALEYHPLVLCSGEADIPELANWLAGLPE